MDLGHELGGRDSGLIRPLSYILPIPQFLAHQGGNRIRRSAVWCRRADRAGRQARRPTGFPQRSSRAGTLNALRGQLAAPENIKLGCGKQGVAGVTDLQSPAGPRSCVYQPLIAVAIRRIPTGGAHTSVPRSAGPSRSLVLADCRFLRRVLIRFR